MPPRSRPGELPKPILKQGGFGCLPLNALTLSCLHHGHVECLLGFRDTEETLALKNRTSLPLTEGRKKIAVSLTGRFFNSYSDALYRGQLPEVLLAAPSAERLPDFLADLTEYIEKLAKMGFFLPRKQSIQRDAVGELIPCVILTGNGLLFSRFVTGLLSALKGLRHEHPSLNDELCSRILGRFVRGFLNLDAAGLSPEALTTSLSENKTLITKFPREIRIAGGDFWTQSIIQNVLAAHNLNVTLENHGQNAPERLEFQNALWRVSNVILPNLVTKDLLSEIEAEALSPQIQAGIWTIGIKRAALTESERPAAPKPTSETATKAAKRKASPDKAQKQSPASLGWGDVAIMASLNGYAQELNLPEEGRLFESLTQQLLSCCEQS